jgi:O-antigen ligase
MPEYVRALIYVLVVAVPAFVIAKKIAVPLVDESEFRQWRNCWIASTCAAFLSSSFLTFAAITLLMSVYVLRSAKNPIYFYIILMFAAPCVPVSFGIPGILNKIVELNPPRLLALFILCPVAITLWIDPKNRQLGFLDLCVGSFWILVAALSLRYGDLNSVLRALLQYFLDILVPYFVFSRALKTAKEVNRAILAFAVAAIPLAAAGLFEMWKEWRVYYIIVQQWDVVLVTPYLVRDNMLRAAATSIEPIAFGFVCMTGAGCIVALRMIKSIPSLWYYSSLGLLLAGLWSSLSRGPWLGFAVFAVVVLAAHPRAALKVLAGVVPLVLYVVFFSPSPFFQRFVNLLPFIGSADKGSESYRSDLFANAIIVIDRYPLFGSQTFLDEPEMQRMVQGQGIVDVVNSYLQIALEYGLVGLFLFLTFFAALAASLAAQAVKPSSNPSRVNHAGILALLLSMLFTIATTSSVSVIPFIYWAFAGVCVALSRLGRTTTWDPPMQARRKMRVLIGVAD